MKNLLFHLIAAGSLILMFHVGAFASKTVISGSCTKCVTSMDGTTFTITVTCTGTDGECITITSGNVNYGNCPCDDGTGGIAFPGQPNKVILSGKEHTKGKIKDFSINNIEVIQESQGITTCTIFGSL